MERIKKEAHSHGPKETVNSVSNSSGGMLFASCAGKLPRNEHQVANVRYAKKAKKSHADDDLFIAMTECKSKDVTARFVRDVKAAPEPALVLATDKQLDDVIRFATNSEEFCIVTVDPTFNLGDFDVTPMTYRYLLLETLRTRKQPVFLGPILIHYRKTFSTYLYFASTLVGLRRDLEKLQAFGTDGEIALVDAFSHEFGYAIHLSCAIHLRRNVKQQLQDRKFPEERRKVTLEEIFGGRRGTAYIEGLIDSKSCSEFDSKLAALKPIWAERELKEDGCTPGFHDWFLQHKAEMLKCSAICPVREKAGLGNPPVSFTTNASESLNSVIKSKVDYEKSELLKFIEKMQCLVDDQFKEVERAVCRRGKYRFRMNYQFLEVDEQAWFNMTPEMRLKHMAKVHSQVLIPEAEDTIPMGRVPSSSTTNEITMLSESRTFLSIHFDSFADSVKTPHVVLEGIWKKATDIVNDPLKISSAPGCSSLARMVESRTGKRPHLVTTGKGGKFMCDSDCPNYKSFGICSHLVASAEVNHMLPSFLEYFKKRNQVPNLSALAKAGMPAGRKGGVTARKRTKQDAATMRVLFNPGTACSPASPPAPPPLHPSTPLQPSTQLPPLHPSTQPPLPRPSVPFARISNINTRGISGNVFVSQPGPNASLAFQESRPFNLHFIRGNISRCAGCKAQYAKQALPPCDLCIQHQEWRQITFATSSTPTSLFSNVYYHSSLFCIQVNWPNFLPHRLIIPPDVHAALLPIHWEHLNNEFGIENV